MSKTCKVTKDLSLTRFWGGDKRKRCVQITRLGVCPNQYVELTVKEMRKLIEFFLDVEDGE